jgi:chaperonin cofactor prefoldin
MATKKTINVKVSVSKIITALEKSLEDRKKKLSDYEKADKQFQKDHKEFMDSIGELFRSGTGKVISTSGQGHWRNNSADNTKYEITVQMPASVKSPVSPESISTWQVQAEIEEIRNAISILKMTDEETVSTNTYSGVAQYI